jgi:hypothetical protein
LTARRGGGGNAGLMESEENEKAVSLAFPQPLEIAKNAITTLPPHGYCDCILTFLICTRNDISALHQQNRFK